MLYQDVGHSLGTNVWPPQCGIEVVLAGQDFPHTCGECQGVIPGGELFSLDGRSGWLTDVAFSPDGTSLSTASNGWYGQGLERSITGQELLTLGEHTHAVYGVAFSPARSGTDRSVDIYTLDTRELLRFASSRVTRNLMTAECSLLAVGDLPRPTLNSAQGYS